MYMGKINYESCNPKQKQTKKENGSYLFKVQHPIHTCPQKIIIFSPAQKQIAKD